MLTTTCPPPPPPSTRKHFASQGVPFRETHHISGAAVKMSEDKGVPLDSLTPADLRTLHDAFEDDVQEVWNYETRFVVSLGSLFVFFCVVFRLLGWF